MRQLFIGIIVGSVWALNGAEASPNARQAVAIIQEPVQASSPSFIKDYGFTLAPLAFVKFCVANGAECEARPRKQEGAAFSLNDLSAVNQWVNDAIAPRRKPTDPLSANWTISPASGDCNDYAVTKRSRLIAAGWPSDLLRLAVVITPTGQGHLVLVVRTGEGDVVLDNLSRDVRPWQETGYDWVSMQSSENPRFWVAIGDRGRLRQQKLQALAANLN